MEVRDIAIIGTGPAGVSAVLNAKIRKKDYYLFGSEQLSRKVGKSPEILNYPGFPKISGSQLNQQLSDHLKEMGIFVTPGHVQMIYPMGEYFSILADTKEFRAKTVILAVGVETVKPLDGEKELTGKGVSYCATCDGGLYRGRRIGVICDSQELEEEVRFLSGLAGVTYYWPLMKQSKLMKMQSQELEQAEATSLSEIVYPDSKPSAILGDKKVNGVRLSDGTVLEMDGFFFLKKNLPPAVLLPKLELEEGHIKVNRRMETNVPGCFAAGDCTGRPYQLAKSVGEGNIAAHSVVKYLAEHF